MMPTLEHDGYVIGEYNPLSSECMDLLHKRVNTYKKGEHGDLNMEAIDKEIDIHVLVVNEVCLDNAFHVFLNEMKSSLWSSHIVRMCKQQLWLAKVELHCHNLTTDGPVHCDELREKLRVWNVAIPLHSVRNAGTTGIYSSEAEEDAIEKWQPTCISCPVGGWYMFDANRLHVRKGASTKRSAKQRVTLMITFTDGKPSNETGFLHS